MKVLKIQKFIASGKDIYVISTQKELTNEQIRGLHDLGFIAEGSKFHIGDRWQLKLDGPHHVEIIEKHEQAED